MGFQAFLSIGQKIDATTTTVAPGAGAFPVSNEVSILSFTDDLPSIPDPADVVRTIGILRDYLLETDSLRSLPGTVALIIVTTIEEGKAGIRLETLFTGLVAGDIAIAVDAPDRARGSRNTVNEAYKQLSDWILENILKKQNPITFGVPSGSITQINGTYASAATIELGGTDLWERGTIIDISGTTDAGVFGVNITLDKNMGVHEVGLRLSEFLKGWSQATFKNVRHPTNVGLSTIGMLAFAGGLTVSFDSLTITPVP